MRIDFLQEPKLEFGLSEHVDIRFGLMNYGPVDYASSLAPKEIRAGIIGTTETIEGVQRWFEKCRNEISAKPSKQPNLFPKFPGFCKDTAFQSTLIMDSRLQRNILSKNFGELVKKNDRNEIVRESANLFYGEMSYMVQEQKIDVIICALPQSLVDITLFPFDAAFDEESKEEKRDEIEGILNFHHLLKSKAMDLKVPVQLIIPSTYDESKRRRKKRRPQQKKPTQDEATRAWNLHTALYYKAKGIPWRLHRDPTEFTTCYVGVSFYKTLDASSLQTSVAQVFNERGQGVIVRGGPANISKVDRQPHLDRDNATKLLDIALSLYKGEHKNLPARVVIHKSSTYTSDEIDGFLSAIHNHKIDLIDLISISKSLTRLFRIGSYPPLRGTFLSLDERSHILYTRGSVDFFSTYPGMYVPRPLLFRCEHTEQTPIFLAKEILALTKMNWNNTQFDGGDPITLHAAYQVKGILKYVDKCDDIPSSYRFYM